MTMAKIEEAMAGNWATWRKDYKVPDPPVSTMFPTAGPAGAAEASSSSSAGLAGFATSAGLAGPSGASASSSAGLAGPSGTSASSSAAALAEALWSGDALIVLD